MGSCLSDTRNKKDEGEKNILECEEKVPVIEEEEEKKSILDNLEKSFQEGNQHRDVSQQELDEEQQIEQYFSVEKRNKVHTISKKKITNSNSKKIGSNKDIYQFDEDNNKKKNNHNGGKKQIPNLGFNFINEEEENNEEDYDEEVLYIILIVNNASKNPEKVTQYYAMKSYLENFQEIAIITIECSFLSLPFMLTEPYFEPYNIQIRTESPLNLKYNLINIAISKMPNNFRNICWIDTNIQFLNDDWVKETILALKKFSVVKLYDEVNLAYKNQEDVIEEKKHQRTSFMNNKSPKTNKSLGNPQIGNAWAFKRDFVEKTFGLLDFCIIDEADEFINYCLEG